MKRLIHGITLLAAAATLAKAHFVFVVPQPGSASANIFISETLEPDSAVDNDLIKGTKLALRGANGKDADLSLVKSGTVYAVRIAGSGTRVVHGLADLGVSGNAEKQYLLLYHPKTILGDAFDKSTVLGTAVPTELIPVGKTGALKFQLMGRGKPMPDAEVTVILPDGHEMPAKTDKSGQTQAFAQTGRYGAWARFWEASASGERDGKKYSETHHYATLVADVGGPGSTAAAATHAPFATLPQATASFGAIAYDPKTEQWSQGPKLQNAAILGFAPAALVRQGSLSVGDGTRPRMNEAGTGDSILVIGGAADGKNSDLIEAVAIKK